MKKFTIKEQSPIPLGLSGIKSFARKNGLSMRTKSSGGRVPYVYLKKDGKEYGPFDPNTTTSKFLSSKILGEGKMLSEENPCWKGYVQLGTKMKGGKKVPNCVKKNSSINEEKEGFMYITQLEDIIEYCENLLDMMEEDDDLPAWIQDKITIAHHNLEASSKFYDSEYDDYEEDDDDYEDSENFSEGKKSMKFESEYKDFFKKALDREGKSISSMSTQEKKDFFNRIDSQWKSKNESYRRNKNCCKG